MPRPRTKTCERCAQPGELVRIETPAGRRLWCALCRNLVFRLQWNLRHGYKRKHATGS